MRRRPLLLAASLAASVIIGLFAGTAPVRAQALSVDLTEHQVAITTGFQGTRIVLFGATDDDGGDVIVMVRGPAEQMSVRRKRRAAGIWMNGGSIDFEGVPGYYAVFGSKPVSTLLPVALRRLEGIGVDSLQLSTEADVSPATADIFRAALIHDMQQRKLYAGRTGHVDFLGGKLFRATLTLPTNVPIGDYQVVVLLVRKSTVVASETTSISVFKAGLEAEINDYATDHALLYGIFAVIASAMLGWTAVMLFRNT
jgi:uncharacterized protein (TIGR02186 family)